MVAWDDLPLMTAVEVNDDSLGAPEPEGGGGPRTAVRKLEWGALPATAAVIIVTTSVLAWRLLGAFTFMMDDLAQFDMANRVGLSSDLLLMNMAQHFGPINRVAHLLELRVADVDPTTAALIVTGLVGVLLVVTAWLTYELGMALVRRLLVVATAGTALTVLDTAVWNDAALHILLALIATYLVLAMHVRGIRTSRSWWHVASVLVFAIGLLVQERVALALPLAVFVDVFLLWRDERIGRRARRLLAVKWPLLAMAAIGGLAGYWIHQHYVAPDAQQVQLVPALRTALLALTGYQFPQLVGHQPVEPLGPAGQLGTLLVICLVFAVLIAVNRRNAGPILLFIAVFALYWSFLVFSPMMNDGVIVANAQRLQNGMYVTVPALIAVFSLEGPPALSAALRAPPVRPGGPSRPGRRRRPGAGRHDRRRQQLHRGQLGEVPSGTPVLVGCARCEGCLDRPRGDGRPPAGAGQRRVRLGGSARPAGVRVADVRARLGSRQPDRPSHRDHR